MTNIKQKFKFAVIATDVVIFTIKENQLQVLLIKMRKRPYKDYWAIPGGLISPDESLESAAQRNLLVKTGIKDTYLEQLYTFGGVDRDPFGRVVSVAYFALIPYSSQGLKTTKEYADISWYPVMQLPKLAYDNDEMISVAIKRLQAKLEYTNVVYSLLPKNFTLTELQTVYEIILDRKLDKRNFRKKILSLKLIKKTNKETYGSAHRPAALYSFASRSPKIVEIL